MYILLSHHTWNLAEVRYSRHHYPDEASPRRGLTHVWPPANHTKDTPTPIYKPSAHIHRRHTRNAWPEAIHTCITPTWTSAKCASPRWGQHTHTGQYLVEVTYAKLLWTEFIAATKP
ncbi:hypothetical protein [uncultured Muribaculum sp.]|uniref:hypothetical protein n=1 Tax=uncultured Muribaculum sp. TaxID=1918613 RepID=UPI00272AB941|nr:hypothetical protein [uncultured Muribaculum sp.]